MFAEAWDNFKRYSIRLTSSHKRGKLQRYLFPVLLTGLIIAAKFFLLTYVSDYTAYHLLTIVIILSAWYGGLGPGLLATLLTGVIDTTLFLPAGESYFGPYNIISTAILVIGGVFISFISEAKRHADMQKDDFIGFASHELKNPLATIQGYAQMLQMKQKTLRTRRVLSIAASIEAQTKRATNLINELLDVTKIESGKLRFTPEIFILFDLVKSIIADQKVLIASHKIILKGKSRKKVRADKYRVGQVLINMITNAVKYSPKAKQIVVAVENKKGEVVVSVQDFGKGIAEENLTRVFDPYFRERSAEHKSDGLGLGLYISSEIIKKHGGRLWVESPPAGGEGKGSIFYFSLPAK